MTSGRCRLLSPTSTHPGWAEALGRRIFRTGAHIHQWVGTVVTREVLQLVVVEEGHNRGIYGGGELARSSQS